MSFENEPSNTEEENDDKTETNSNSSNETSLIETAFKNLSPIFCNYPTPTNNSSNKPATSDNDNSSSSSSSSSTYCSSPNLSSSSLTSSSQHFTDILSLTYPQLCYKSNNKFDNASILSSTPSSLYSHPYKQDFNIKNTIILENIIRGIDKRTTLMIRHIPNKYTLKTITEEINQKFKNKYDVFYLPIDYNNNCNLGFAFINFINPLHIVDFYETFRGKKWKRFLSEKRCELAYAKIQGKHNLMIHFEKGIVMNSQTSDKRPLILDINEPFPKITMNAKYRHIFEKAFPDIQYHYNNSKQYIIINNFN
jgi:hypothetical protein